MKTRRELLEEVPSMLLAAVGLAALTAGKAEAAEGTGSVIDRMREDIKRALAKPADQRRWAMAIDLKKCIGCKACTVACRSENKTSPGVDYRPVMIEEEGRFPEVKRTYRPRPCMHCEKPACLTACDAQAIKKTPDGVVYVDYETCVGIKACIPACPYGVPKFDEGGYFTSGTPAVQPNETAAAYEMGVKRPRLEGKAPMGRMRKCTYCFHRLQVGLLPSCVTTCLGYANFMGDLKDEKSLIYELSRSPRVRRLKEEAGTKPTTFYLV